MSTNITILWEFSKCVTLLSVFSCLQRFERSELIERLEPFESLAFVSRSAST
jgi:hypothetical protein